MPRSGCGGMRCSTSTCDLVLRGLCSLEEALDSSLWELGYGVEDRREVITRRTSPGG
jgi:hypothetical protein